MVTAMSASVSALPASVRPAIHRDELDQTLGRDPYAYATNTGRDALEQRFRDYAAGLPRGPTGVVSATVVTDRACPLCASGSSRERFVKYGFPIHACERCAFEFARPALDQEKVQSSSLGDPELSQEHLAFISQPVYRECAARRFEFELQQLLGHWKLSRAPRSFLEIGSSTGIGLDVARGYGLTALGIEPNAEAAAVARSAGHRVERALFGRGAVPDAAFDLIMTLDVLEHVPDPLAFLEAARDALVPGGLLLVQVPNAGALIVWLEGADNQIYNGLIHLNYFEAGSLDRAARKTGLESVHTTSFLSELGKVARYGRDAVHSACARHAPALPVPLTLDQDWINDSLLGYKLLGIYRRPVSAEW